MKLIFICLVYVYCLLNNIYAQVYVDTSGNDSNIGKIDSPYLTIAKAITVAKAGDTIYVRNGTYNPTATISIGSSKSGTAEKRFCLIAYSGERPVLDFHLLPYNSSNRGIKLGASYWYIKGFDIKRAGDNGMNISGSYNIIENCSFSENYDTGLQLGGGASYNQVINCDSYFNADPGQGNADGFSPKLDVGTGNYFYGCRAWQNSDDGWDGYMRGANDVSTILENCWCFKNGYLKSGAASSGNGNGYKMGGGDNSNSDSLMHHFKLIRCIAFDNRVKGFDQNNNMGSMILLNCSAHRNGSNYVVARKLNSGQKLILKNCISFNGNNSIGSFAEQENNSWLKDFDVTNDDFITIDPAEAYGPRNPDGSLPDITYLHLANGSDLIDSGVEVGIACNGSAPDLGAFESNYPVSVNNHNKEQIKFSLEQNYPNPFNPLTSIQFTVNSLQFVSLKVFDITGREVARLVNKEMPAGEYIVEFNATDFASGIYLYRLQCGDYIMTKKMILLK